MNKIIQISFHDDELYGIDSKGNLYKWISAHYDHSVSKYVYDKQGWQLLNDNRKEVK